MIPIKLLFHFKIVIRSAINYSNNHISPITVRNKEFVKKFKVGQNANLPFLHWKLNLEDLSKFKLNEEILVRFNSL